MAYPASVVVNILTNNKLLVDTSGKPLKEEIIQLEL